MLHHPTKPINSNQLVIRERRVTKEEAQELIREIRRSPNILGYTEREWREFPFTWVAEVDGRLAGVCCNIDLLAGWTEMAAIYVREEFQGHSIGRKLFTASVSSVEQRGRSMYIASRNPRLVKLMREWGMTIRPHPFGLPPPIVLAKLKYFLNAYRIVEFVRKAVAFSHRLPFAFGIKKFHRNRPSDVHRR